MSPRADLISLVCDRQLVGVVAVYTKLLGVHNPWYVPGDMTMHRWELNREGIEPSGLRYVVLLITS